METNIKLVWVFILLAISWGIIVFLFAMLITKISALRTSQEFSKKLEEDFRILQSRYNDAVNQVADLGAMMHRFQQNIDRYKIETEAYIKYLKKDDDYKQN